MAEDELKEISVLRVVAEVAVDGVAIFGRNEQIDFANTAFALMYGLAYGSELTGRPWASLFEPEWARYIQTACFDEAGEHTWSGRLVGRRPDGAPFEMEASFTPLPNRHGILLIARDVSEKVRAEMELREARALFKAIVDQMPRVAIMGFGRDGKMVHCNATARALYGLPPDAALAPSVSRVLKDGERLAELEVAIKLAWEEGQGSQPKTWRHVSEEGPKWLLSTVFPAVVQGGATEVLLVDVDVTREIQSSEALREMEKQILAFQRQEFMGNLSRGVARQISSPLMAIFATLEALQNKLKGDRDVSAFLHVLRQQGQRLTKLMNDLVLLGQAEDAPRGPCDLVPLAHEVVGSITIFPGHEGAEVRLETSKEPLVALICPARVRQALYQLLDNALVFAPKPGAITVTLRKEGGDAVFEVRDEGPGFPEESKGRLLTPFFTTREDAPGLGLALAERIALDHGGRIEARNNAPGPGATFSLFLPLVG